MPRPQVLTSIAETRSTVRVLRAAGGTLGLVPTMGALHEGHLSLVRRAKSENQQVLATIFVNPAQFGPQEDFRRYPRTLEADLELLGSVHCDFVFVPTADEIYPPGFSTYIEPPAVALPLEGQFRPGHFRGVATVVLKLLEIAQADVAYFGQKDFQQAAVIRRMVADLNVPVRIEVCPIIREPDGLAISSRNRYLSPDERNRAAAIYQSLERVAQLLAQGERQTSVLVAEMRRILTAAGFQKLDYATIADRETLAELDHLDRPAVALIAAHLGTTRLIDNRLLDAP